MKFWSISFAFRLGLGFHALNNEGNDGSNLMQPRRIDVGDVTYDGVSGEIVRHHVLENFVGICRREQIPMLPLSEGLHPDRGPLGIRAAARLLSPTANLANDNLYASVRRAIKECPVLDVGGYLAAWQDVGRQAYIAESAYINSACAPLQMAGNRVDVEVVKRDSCFDVGWLISEAPQDLTVTQHSAFRSTFALNSRYSQTMRSNIYGGVIRADLHRIGTDDYWYLQAANNGQRPDRLALPPEPQKKRQEALVEAIADFIASPKGAKTAAWAPHVFLTEGAVLLCSSRTAPFCSPIKVDLTDSNAPVKPEPDYAAVMERLKKDQEVWFWRFADASSLMSALGEIKTAMDGKADDDASKEKQ